MASICLRANWELGGLKDIYIKYEKAGDQSVGRAVNGLPILKNGSQRPLLTLVFFSCQVIARSKENSFS